MNRIAILGLGYVGLPLAVRFAESGIPVLGLDVDTVKVAAINRGESYIGHLASDRIARLVRDDLLAASADFCKVTEVDAVIICVPTPLNRNREPDLSFVLDSARAIAPYLAGHGDCGLRRTEDGARRTEDGARSTEDGARRTEDGARRTEDGGRRTNTMRPKLVVLESTTYPGTTDTDLREVLEAGSGLKAGEGFHLAYSPEREDPGRKDHSVKTIPKVMGGYTPACLDRCIELYSRALDKVHPVGSCRVAEATKLTENIFRSVNIALVNELKVVFHAMGIDVWDVIDAAATKPFGYMPFYPGPGLGGHCIPIDPFYLTWKAREYEQHTRFIELAGEINTAMPEYVLRRVGDALNEDGKSIKGSRILLLGMAYKPNVEDDRESPSYVLMRKLEEKGAAVAYSDPFVPRIGTKRDFPEFVGRESVAIDGNYDCLLLATHHTGFKEFDFSRFTCPLVDTRNCVPEHHRPAKYFRA